MAKIEDLQDLPHRIEKRGEYLRGRGYVVTLRTTYTKQRLVRAGDEEEAMTFALSREAYFSPRYFGKQKHTGLVIEDIEAVAVEESINEDDDE